MPLSEPAGERGGLCFAGGPAEPAVSAGTLSAALANEAVESFRPLLPVGYNATAKAYRDAALQLQTSDLTNHYTAGLEWFHEQFVPYVKGTLAGLSGGHWDLSNYCAYAAGSDVDMMSHLIEAAGQDVVAYPADWFGFQVGCSEPERVRFTAESCGKLACLCVPSVRNGHFTEDMLGYLSEAETCLLNINLYPTLRLEERRQIAAVLEPLLPKCILSISFSRGFALTASQLGLILIHPDHPLRNAFQKQWEWFTYFYNAIAARAFTLLDLAEIERVNQLRHEWVMEWLKTRNLPALGTGSYYVKSFQVSGTVPPALETLVRGSFLRLCFKPPFA